MPRTRLLPPANEVREGYVFTGICLSTGGACMVGRGGMHCWQGGMHGWQGGMHGCWGGVWLLGACVIAGGYA